MGRLRWPWKKPNNATTVKDRWSLDTRLLSWSRHDHLTLRDAVNGFVATGVSGGGKTSGPVAAVSRALLRAGFGGIFHAVKTDDADLALQWCHDTGRMDDVIFFGPKHPARFNFLDYELSRSGEGAGLTDNIVDLLLNVAEIRGRKSDKGGGENGGFFVNAEKQILRVSVDTLARAKGRVTGSRYPPPDYVRSHVARGVSLAAMAKRILLLCLHGRGRPAGCRERQRSFQG